jgi:hypothetical protein
MDISAIYEHFTRDQIQVVLQAFSRVQLKNYIKGKSEYLLQKRKNFDERLEMKAKGKDASELLKLRSILKAIEQDIDYKLIEDILKQASISEEINNFFRELIQQRNDFLQCKASLEAYMQTNMQDELSDSNESIYLKFWELMTTNHVRELGLNSAADIFDYGIKTTQDLDYLGISPSIDTSIKELTALLKAASSITDVTQLTHCYCGQLPLNEKEKTQLIKKCGDLKQTKEGIEEFLKELKSVLDACHPLKRLKKYLQSSQELTNVWSQLRQGQQLHSLSELITSGLIDKENVFNMCDILKHTGMKRRKMVFN